MDRVADQTASAAGGARTAGRRQAGPPGGRRRRRSLTAAHCGVECSGLQVAAPLHGERVSTPLVRWAWQQGRRGLLVPEGPGLTWNTNSICIAQVTGPFRSHPARPLTAHLVSVSAVPSFKISRLVALPTSGTRYCYSDGHQSSFQHKCLHAQMYRGQPAYLRQKDLEFFRVGIEGTVFLVLTLPMQ